MAVTAPRGGLFRRLDLVHHFALHLFETRITCDDTGRFGYTVRILPFHPNLIYPVDMGLICWA